MSRGVGAAVLGGVVLLGLSGVACSASAPDKPKPEADATTAPHSTAPNVPPDEERYLEVADLRRYRNGTPAAAVIRLWYAIQQRDMLTAYRLLDRTFSGRRSLAHFAEYVLADYPRWLVRPKVIAQERAAREASITVRYATPSDPRARTTFNLLRRTGRWRIVYEYYLVTRLNAGP